MTLSVVIITKNEEKNIQRCLESVVGIADEIIVVDSFSTDKTEALCKKYPVRFFQEEWKGWGPTKNFANSLASGDYILSLDADEALSLELQKSLREIKNSLEGYYSFRRRTQYCGQWISHCGWYPDIKLRLFPKDQAFWNEAQVHEDVELPNPKAAVQLVSGDINHYSYYTLSEHIERANLYSSLAAAKIAASPLKWLSLHGPIRAFLRFAKSYFFKRGFLDGFFGLCICSFSALEVFLKYAKAAEIRKRGARDRL